MKTTALLSSPSRAAAPSLEFKELKDYKEEKDNKEDKQAQHLNHKPFTKLGSDSHRHVLSFLGKKEVLQARQVSHAFNVVGQSSSWTNSDGQSSSPWKESQVKLMWKKSQEKLKQNLPTIILDERFLGCLQSIYAKSNVKGREVDAFVVKCYGHFGANRAVRMDNAIAGSQRAAPDIYYQLLESIILGDVAEFSRITDVPDFNVNYFIGFLSPLLLAELFPHPQILEKLKSLGAQLLPTVFLRETDYVDNAKHNYLHTRQMYFSQSLLAVKVLPILVNIIVKYTTDCHIGQLIWLGVTQNQPFAENVAYMLDHGGIVYPDSKLTNYLENLELPDHFNDAYKRYRVVGHHSKEMFTALLKRGVDSVHFRVFLSENFTYYSFRTLQLAASLSVHIFKCYLDIYPDYFNRSFSSIPPSFPDLISESANLDCVGELVRQFPNDKSLPALAVRRIVMRMRHDSNMSYRCTLAFRSRAERYADIVEDLRSLVLPNSEEFFSKEWIELAIKHNCHEFLQALNDAEHSTEEKITRTSMTDFLFDTSNQDANSSKKRFAQINMTRFLFDALNQDAELLTIQALLEFKYVDVNAYEDKQTPVLHVLARLSNASAEGHPRLLEIAELLIRHPRASLHLKDGSGWDGLDYICNQRYGSDIEKLLSYARFTLHDVERLLLRCDDWHHGDVVMKILLPNIEPYSNQSLLTELFGKLWHSERSVGIFILLERADLIPTDGNESLKNIRKFCESSNFTLVTTAILHPYFDMKYFQNKKVTDKELFSGRKYLPLQNRRKIDLAETALKAGKFDEADKNFRRARFYCGGFMLDKYLKQVIKKFPGEYHFTGEQRKRLFSSPGILRSDDASILILLAQENLKNYPLLAEVLCERALTFHYNEEERAELEKIKTNLVAHLDFVHASISEKESHDAREKLLVIAKQEVEKKTHLVFNGPHKLMAVEVVSLLEHGYDKWIERRYLLKMCIKLVDKEVSIRDPFFAALLSAVEKTIVPAPKPKLESAALRL